MADTIEELTQEIRDGVTSVDAAAAELVAKGGAVDDDEARQVLAWALGAREVPGTSDELTPLPEFGL